MEGCGKSSCVLITETVGLETSLKGRSEGSVKRGRGRPAKISSEGKGMKKGKKVSRDGSEGEEEKVWICPGCKEPDDGSPMIGCDNCDDWYHWPCVGIKSNPGDGDWFCPRCRDKEKKSLSESKLGQSKATKRSSSSTADSPPPKCSKISTSKASTSKASSSKIPTMKAAIKSASANASKAASSACSPPPRRGRPPKQSKRKVINKSSPKCATNKNRKRSADNSSSDESYEEDEEEEVSDAETIATASSAGDSESSASPLTPSFPRKTARKSSTIPPRRGSSGKNKSTLKGGTI